MNNSRGPFIEETRWCPHGKRYDDYCEGCEQDESETSTTEEAAKK